MESKSAILISSVAMTTLFCPYVEKLMFRSMHVLKISFSETRDILAYWLAPPANYHDGRLVLIAQEEVSSLRRVLCSLYSPGLSDDRLP